MSSFNLNNFNDLMSQANQLITCGPSCQQDQSLSQLQQNYLNAEANMVSAPQQFKSAQKAYYTYTKGQAGYNEYIDKELKAKADAIANQYQEKIDYDISSVKEKINTYQGLLVNFNNIIDLYKKYKTENNKLENNLKTKSSDILTNDRKTYYEDQGITSLNTYYSFLIGIYIFVVVVFLLSIFLVKTNVSFKVRFFVLFLMIIYPFVCYGLFHLLYKFYNNIKGIFPSNAYRTL